MTTTWAAAEGRAKNTYKNKLKSLRQSYKAANLTDEEYEKKKAEAKAVYEAAKAGEYQTPIKVRQQAEAEAWLKDHTLPSLERELVNDVEFGNPGGDNCDGSCVVAENRVCKCPCMGVNHGAATGMHPAAVQIPGTSLEERVELGLLDQSELDDWKAMKREEKSEILRTKRFMTGLDDKYSELSIREAEELLTD